jgi:hypothetical protein
MTNVRFGSASIVVSFNDKEGFVVRHPELPDVILASKPASECEASDWDKVWKCFEEIGLVRPEV